MFNRVVITSSQLALVLPEQLIYEPMAVRRPAITVVRLQRTIQSNTNLNSRAREKKSK